MADFYVKTSNGLLGPMDASKLRHMVADGIVDPETVVGDGTKWVRAQSVKGLFSEEQLRSHEAKKLAPVAVAVKPQELKVQVVVSEKPKSKDVALLLWLLLGGMGVHRFYLGHYVMGAITVFRLFLCGLTVGLWLLIHIPMVFIDGMVLVATPRSRLAACKA